MEILVLLGGIIVGGGIAWLIARVRFSAEAQVSTSSILIEQEKNKNLEALLFEFKQGMEAERKKVLEVNNALAAAEADYRNIQEKLYDQKKELENLNEKFAIQFKNLANEIFEEKSKKFTDQNKSNMFDLLRPLGEKIVEFEKKVEDTHKDTISRNSALREQLENLQRLNLQMTKEAENLTRALKGDSKTQGAWGEFILESILEKSGLERDREFTIQESFTTEDGRFRPDIIIRLPENRHVVIDSKVSLTAYNNFVNASTESEKKLYEEALEKRIVFVSPTLLIPSLQLIKNVWKQEYQNRNSQEIAKHATSLYEKFVGFSNDLIDIGSQIKKTQTSYEGAMNKLTTGNGNLVKSLERFKTLGLKPPKSIDQRLIDRSGDQADLFE